MTISFNWRQVVYYINWLDQAPIFTNFIPGIYVGVNTEICITGRLKPSPQVCCIYSWFPLPAAAVLADVELGESRKHQVSLGELRG